MKKENTWCSDNSFVIEANIESNSPLTKVQLYSRTDQYEEFIAQDMLFESDNTYIIEVQPLEIGTKLEYYISVENEAGKQISRPLPAEQGARITNIIDCSIVSVAALNQQQINVFPNPASAITCIDLSEINTEVSSVDLIDLLGRKIKSIYSQTSGEAYAQKMFFDASLLDSGTYFLRIVQNGKSIIKKISIH